MRLSEGVESSRVVEVLIQKDVLNLGSESVLKVTASNPVYQ